MPGPDVNIQQQVGQPVTPQQTPIFAAEAQQQQASDLPKVFPRANAVLTFADIEPSHQGIADYLNKVNGKSVAYFFNLFALCGFPDSHQERLSILLRNFLNCTKDEFTTMSSDDLKNLVQKNKEEVLTLVSDKSPR